MRFLIVVLVSMCLFSTAEAQNGFVRFSKDSIIYGYLKYQMSPKGEEGLLEYWETKNDKSPQKIRIRDVEQYAIKNDTFRVLKHFRPIDSNEFYYDIIDVKIVLSGNVEVLSISDPFNSGNGFGFKDAYGREITPEGNTYQILYILRETNTGYIRGIPREKEKMMEVLEDFFTKETIDSYGKKINYNSIPKLAAYYNGKMKKK